MSDAGMEADPVRLQAEVVRAARRYREAYDAAEGDEVDEAWNDLVDAINALDGYEMLLEAGAVDA